MDLPTSAYLHVPFCRHRCGYCNFAVVAGREDLVDRYLRAITTELGWLGDARSVRTLYFGGGTPARLPVERLDELLRLAQRWFPPLAGPKHDEWTVEANPADLAPETIRLLAERGVTRLSLGVQSLNAAKLQALERDHTPDDVHRTVSAAHEAGLEVAVDLMFAAPKETLADWVADLEAALAIGVGHVSTYGLTYEKGTPFWSRRERGELAEIDETLQRSMYLTAIDTLVEAGLEHYEVSNFARPGLRSRHNEAYWAGEGYYAAGPGAARYVGGVRETNHRSTTTYLKRVESQESPVAEREELSPEQRAHERLVFGLRRLEGIDLARFEIQAGFAAHDLADGAIEKFIAHGMLEATDGSLRLTREGLLISDALWPELL